MKILWILPSEQAFPEFFDQRTQIVLLAAPLAGNGFGFHNGINFPLQLGPVDRLRNS
jgi:hypothetical protein